MVEFADGYGAAEGRYVLVQFADGNGATEGGRNVLVELADGVGRPEIGREDMVELAEELGNPEETGGEPELATDSMTRPCIPQEKKEGMPEEARDRSRRKSDRKDRAPRERLGD
ncbi:MAG: hypothetical protein LQ346_003023 [Caloplaca aetnensis]|nr:MAG: hypothetical protein LQ346_003023 [Caloplaca aetnensis]